MKISRLRYSRLMFDTRIRRNREIDNSISLITRLGQHTSILASKFAEMCLQDICYVFIS